ncbi:MAG TPA: hypothetical protein VMU04_14170 [Candidatus Acidoferrum sp.]|nr:hypothetical protein [Candidatus Acidoferrum sp.]
MNLAVETKRPGSGTVPSQPGAGLDPLQTEVIELFVELSRLLGHPCKVYNVLVVAAPVLYIGPELSHVSEILDSLGKEARCARAAHGDVNRVIEVIQHFRHDGALSSRPPLAAATERYSKDALLPKLIAELESA